MFSFGYWTSKRHGCEVWDESGGAKQECVSVGAASAPQLGAERGQEWGRRDALENRGHSSGRARVPARRLSPGAWISLGSLGAKAYKVGSNSLRSKVSGKGVGDTARSHTAVRSCSPGAPVRV